MFTLKEQREAAYKAAAELVEQVKAGNEDAFKAAEAKMAEVKALDERIAAADAASERLKAIGGMRADATVADEARKEAPARTLGDHFIQSMKSAGVTLKAAQFAAPEFKAASDTQAVGSAYGPILTDVDPVFAMPNRRQLVIADLFAQGTVSGNAIQYPEFGAIEGGTGTVA